MMQFTREGLSDEDLRSLYRKLLYPRLIEEKMLLLLRQGRISKWFSGIGQEAIAVGATAALEDDEWILPLHRNLGVFTTRGMPLERLFLQWEGRPEGYSKGRERSFHFGSMGYHICGMISHLGPQLSVADGIALACKLREQPKATLVFTGEGGASEGEFHEALNLAAVWDLPVIFLVENNGYALSTPVSEQYRCTRLSERAAGYGMKGMTIDGNNIMEVYRTVQDARRYVTGEHKPILLECMTFRMRGHEEASGTKYVPPELLESWKEKDPVVNFESFLLKENIFAVRDIDGLKSALKQEIDEAVKGASHPVPFAADTATELQDVYAPAPPALPTNRDTGPEVRFVDAISQALRQAMQKHDNLILMGQDIAEYGGAFKITEGLAAEFGTERVRNTPLCESAVIGAALGLSLQGFKAMVEMQFADFVTCGFNQIVNNLAKIHYRWGVSADVVIRMPTGAGVHAGPFHSQSNEAWFTHTPGLKVVYPATPYDAKGLLLAAIEDPNPVLFFEHKALYRSITGPVPENYYRLEIGRSRRVIEGSDVSIITYGMGVEWALEYARNHLDVSVDIIDLRSLAPLDYEGIAATVRHTGKVLILHEDTLTGGLGGEIAAWIGEHCFEWLDAPVMRCASLDTPVPFAKELEESFLGKKGLASAMAQLIRY
jgi:2-oxoisovalerate dehydrogenase E1 component